ncbi:MAG: vitamin K epoxide reductase family protein [Silvanigrellaceae bacterium]|nr:vitamin K epoxide reductase family protein [Silvanigrellaceae bacterium]
MKNLVQQLISPLIRTKLLSLILGIIGFLASLYSLLVHIEIQISPHQGRMCDMTNTINCSHVIGSSFGEIATIPLGAFGLSYFIMVIIGAVFSLKEQASLKTTSYLQFFLACLGFVVAVFLFYISYFKIRVICPVCSLVHFILFTYFILQVRQLIKARKKNKSENISHYLIQKFIIYSICFALPPLAAGLFTPLLIDQIALAEKQPNKSK